MALELSGQVGGWVTENWYGGCELQDRNICNRLLLNELESRCLLGPCGAFRCCLLVGCHRGRCTALFGAAKRALGKLWGVDAANRCFET